MRLSVHQSTYEVCAIVLSMMIRVVPASIETELETCLSEIFTKYFKARSIILYDGRLRNSSYPRTLLPPPKVIQVDKILRLLEGHNNWLMDTRDGRHNGDKETRYKRTKPQSSIFVFDDHQVEEWPKINILFRKIKETEFWNRQGKSLILVYKSHPGLDNAEMAKNAVAGTWRWNKAVNVVVMIIESDRFKFYIWFPYRQPDCRMVEPLPLYDAWHNGKFQYGKDLYPVKIKRDFEGCPIRIAADECYPYSYNNFTAGFETALVNLLTMYFNFTPMRMELPENEDIYMTYLPNGTPTAAFGMLDRQSVDLVYACLMLNIERYNLAESLPTYFHDSLSWFVPTPNKKSHASNIFEAFPEDYWLYIVVTTVAALAVFLLIVKLEESILMRGMPESLIGAGMRVFAMAISSPITMTSKRSLQRCFTFAFAIYSLHITTVYQASLYNLYKSSGYENTYTTLEEAVERNMFVWLRKSTSDMYDPNDGVWKQILQKGRSAYLDKDLEASFNQVAFDKTAIVLFMKSSMLMVISEAYLDKYNQPLMLYLARQFASYPVTIYLSPGHPLFEKMSNTVNNIISAGLVQYWYKSVVRDSRNSADSSVTNVSLQLEHIGGAFMFYGLLMTLATGIFLIENVYWLTHGRKTNKIVKQEELNYRRQLLFRIATDMGRDRFSLRIGRFLSGSIPRKVINLKKIFLLEEH